MTNKTNASSSAPNSPKPAGPPANAESIPVLHTEHLTLRAHQLADLDAASAMWANPNVVRHIGGATRSRAEVWSTIQRGFGCWQLLGFGFWVITDKVTGEFLGEIGFLEGMRDLTPPHTGTPEAGWCLAEKAWGKGYASEALHAVVAWADSNLTCSETICIIDFDNLASARVANKNGYSRSQNALLAGEEIATYRRKQHNKT